MREKVIKVCFVCPKAYPLFNSEVKEVFGGAEVDFYNLATELARDDNFDVSFIVADYGQPAVEKRNNVTIIKSLDFKKDIIRKTASIWHAMGRAGAQIYLQKTASWGTFLVAKFSKLHRRAFVYRTAKADECTGKWPRGYFARKAFRFSLRLADVVLAQNVGDKENLRSALGISAIAIPNGHILSPSAQYSRDNGLWVGRSNKVKGPRVFIDLAESMPHEKFVMVCQRATGDNDYDKLIQRAGEVKNLEFIERVPFAEIDRCFQRAKVLVNTSETEGFPNTFIQACKCGTPILSLNVNPDGFLDSRKCGLCAQGDFQALKKMLEQLLEPAAAAEYSRNARKYAEENHDITRIIERYKEIFYQLADKTHRTGDN